MLARVILAIVPGICPASDVMVDQVDAVTLKAADDVAMAGLCSLE
jgi:hypothetical protein